MAIGDVINRNRPMNLRNICEIKLLQSPKQLIDGNVCITDLI